MGWRGWEGTAMTRETKEKPPVNKEAKYDEECGASHSECVSGWGTCDKAKGHSGSHHCNRCNGVF
jgi:hypothetical protein